MLYVVLAVLSLHIISLPIIVGVRVFADTDNDKGRIVVKLFFIPVYVKRIDIAEIRSILRGDEDVPVKIKDTREKKKKRSAFKKALLSYIKRVAFTAVKLVRVSAFDVDAVIGTGDAAATAFTVSSALITYGQACAFFGLNAAGGDIRPDYDRARLLTTFFGIFSLEIADIIYAVIAGLFKPVKSRQRSSIWKRRKMRRANTENTL